MWSNLYSLSDTIKSNVCNALRGSEMNKRLTVNELIKELQELPEEKKDFPVLIWDAGELMDIISVDDCLDDRVDINIKEYTNEYTG